MALDFVSMVLGILIAALLVLSAPWWFDVPASLLWLTFGYCVVSVLTIRTTPTGMLRLHSEYAMATAAEAVQPVVRTVGVALAWWLMPDVTGFILAYAASEVATALALWIIALRVQPVSVAAISLKAIPARHKGAVAFVLSINMSSVLAVTGKQVMVLLVGTFGGAYLAGGFRIANQLGQALMRWRRPSHARSCPSWCNHAMARSRWRGAWPICRHRRITAVVTAILFGREGLAVVAGRNSRGSTGP